MISTSGLNVRLYERQIVWQVKARQIVELVAAYYGVKPADLAGPSRSLSIARPRHVCAYLLRENTNYSLSEVGSCLGGRDHTTVIHSLKVVRRWRRSDPELAAQVRQLERVLVKRAAETEGVGTGV